MKAKFHYVLAIILLLMTMSTSLVNAQAQSTVSDNANEQSIVGSSSAIAPAPTPRYPRYVLRTSDVLEITFPISPEYDQTVSIQPDGFVSLRGVGDLFVQGKSVPELIGALHKAYGVFLHDPVIDVELKDFEKPYFIAGGQVGHPGKYELRGDTTVAEAVAIAGGFTDSSKHSQVLIFRRVPGGWEEATRLNVKQMMASGSLREDISLRTGDLIYVPKNKLSEIRQFIPSTGLGFGIP